LADSAWNVSKFTCFAERDSQRSSPKAFDPTNAPERQLAGLLAGYRSNAPHGLFALGLVTPIIVHSKGDQAHISRSCAAALFAERSAS
jgi:hypothetical protein